MGQIARPNHDELRIREISPKHGEREQQISQMMEILFAYDLGQRRAWSIPGEHNDDECQCAQHLADANQQWKNCRIPVRFHRHHPINVCKGDGKRINHQTRPAELAQFYCRLDRTRRVLFGRPFHKQSCNQNPDREDKDRANDKRRLVDVSVLVLQDLVGRDARSIRPRIKLR